MTDYGAPLQFGLWVTPEASDIENISRLVWLAIEQANGREEDLSAIIQTMEELAGVSSGRGQRG
jgi:hypothetical protein